MAEFEEFIKTLKSNQSQNFSIEVPIDTKSTKGTNLLESAVLSSGINDSDTITWYSLFDGWSLNDIFRWCNVTIEYTYDWKDGRPYFVSYSNVTSYLTGVTICSWQQTAAPVNFTTKHSQDDTASIKVDGYYLLGVSINGASVGFKNKETWNCSLTLIPQE